MQKLFLFIGITFLLATITTQSVFAQTPTCPPVYGGGLITPTPCAAAPTTPTPTINMTDSGGKGGGGGMAPVQPTVPPTSKGGIPVYTSPQVTQMPNSGPEAFLLGALPVLGAVGVYLRRKTHKKSLNS